MSSIEKKYYSSSSVLLINFFFSQNVSSIGLHNRIHLCVYLYNRWIFLTIFLIKLLLSVFLIINWLLALLCINLSVLSESKSLSGRVVALCSVQRTDCLHFAYLLLISYSRLFYFTSLISSLRHSNGGRAISGYL